MSGPDGGFTWYEPALKKFAQSSQQRAAAFAQCLTQAQQLTLSSDAFGHLPDVSGVYASYDKYVDACEKGISQAGGVMSVIEEDMLGTISYYQAAEKASTSAAAAADDAAAAALWKDTVKPEQQITSPTQPAEPAP